MKDWHIRMTITSFCNYECVYCSKKRPCVFLDKNEIVEILEAAFSSGIKRVHWTGGEPTCHPDLLECVNAAQDIGFKEQIISTNGAFPNPVDMCASPISRFNISLDTIDKKLYKTLTNKDNLYQVLDNIARVVDTGKLVKINCVVMKNNIDEIPAIIKKFSEYNMNGSERIVLRFIQFYPSNPNQLNAGGLNYWRKQYVTYDDILDRIGRCRETEVAGDNPTFRYFELQDYPIKVGILALYSWCYLCGGCLKLRVTPLEEASICLSDDKTFVLKGLSLEDKTETIKEAMKRRETINSRSRMHYNPNLGLFRFGLYGESINLSDLNNMIALY
jgi:cyclic pyranopterin phosphate synthase